MGEKDKYFFRESETGTTMTIEKEDCGAKHLHLGLWIVGTTILLTLSIIGALFGYTMAEEKALDARVRALETNYTMTASKIDTATITILAIEERLRTVENRQGIVISKLDSLDAKISHLVVLFDNSLGLDGKSK